MKVERSKGGESSWTQQMFERDQYWLEKAYTNIYWQQRVKGIRFEEFRTQYWILE